MSKNYLFNNNLVGITDYLEAVTNKRQEDEKKIKEDWNQEASKFDSIDWSGNQLKVLTGVHTFYNELKSYFSASGKFIPPSLKTNSLAAAWVKKFGRDKGNAEVLFSSRELRITPKEGYTNFTLVLSVFYYLLNCEACNVDKLEKVKMHKETVFAVPYLEANTSKYRIVVAFSGKPYRYIEIRRKGE